MAREAEHPAGRKGRAGSPAVETTAAVRSSPNQLWSSAAVEESGGVAEPATAKGGVDRPDSPRRRPRQGQSQPSRWRHQLWEHRRSHGAPCGRYNKGRFRHRPGRLVQPGGCGAYVEAAKSGGGGSPSTTAAARCLDAQRRTQDPLDPTSGGPQGKEFDKTPKDVPRLPPDPSLQAQERRVQVCA